MRLQLTAIYETDDRVVGRVAEMPGIRAEGRNLEEVRARLAEKVRRSLEQARHQALARARPAAHVEDLAIELGDDIGAGKCNSGRRGGAEVRTRQRGGTGEGRAGARPRRRSKAEEEFWQALLETGRIDEIPLPPARGARREEHEPIPIQGKPISQEIIEDRR